MNVSVFEQLCPRALWPRPHSAMERSPLSHPQGFHSHRLVRGLQIYQSLSQSATHESDVIALAFSDVIGLAFGDVIILAFGDIITLGFSDVITLTFGDVICLYFCDVIARNFSDVTVLYCMRLVITVLMQLLGRISLEKETFG